MINVLVIGSGAYVSGRNTTSFGTILPSLIEGTRNKTINKITVVSKHASSHIEFQKKVNEIQKISNVKLNYSWHTQTNSNQSSYKNAIKNSDKNTVVIISTPDHLHYEMAKFALEQKKHVIVVKPLTLTKTNAKSLINLAKKNKLHAVVDFHKRFDLTNLKIFEKIQSKTLGDLLHIHVEYSQQKIIPMKIFKSWAEETNIFQYLGTHYVDMIYFLTHAKPYRVTAVGQKNFLKKRGIDTYDAIEAIIEWKNGKKVFSSTFLCNWIDPNSTSAVSYQSMKFFGTKGRIESDQKNRGLTMITDDDGIEDINPYFNQKFRIENYFLFKGYGIDSFLQFFEDCNLIFESKKVSKDFENLRPTFNNSVYSVYVIEAINKSLKSNGKWIQV